jgi:hypothetical protein
MQVVKYLILPLKDLEFILRLLQPTIVATTTTIKSLRYFHHANPPSTQEVKSRPNQMGNLNLAPVASMLKRTW